MNAPEPTESGTGVVLGTDEGFALRAVAGGVQTMVREMAGLVAERSGIVERGEWIDVTNRVRFQAAADELAALLASGLPVPHEYELRLVRVPPEKRRALAAVHAAGHAVVGASFGCKVVKVELGTEPEHLAAEAVTWGKGVTAFLGTPCRPPDPVRIKLQPQIRIVTTAILAGYWAELAAAPDIVPVNYSADLAMARRLAALYADPGGEADWLASGDGAAARLVSEHLTLISSFSSALLQRGRLAGADLDEFRADA
jgi:hypothetical protein